jgi:hypothetical protein
MRKSFLSIAVLLFLLMNVNSYSLDNFTYKGIAINSSGQLLPKTFIDVRITITSPTILTAFIEIHGGIKTDQFGAFTIEVGNGVSAAGSSSLSSINTKANTYIKCETREQGGNWVLSKIQALSIAMQDALNDIKKFAWGLEGNSGRREGIDFLGTTDGVPFEMRVVHRDSTMNSLTLDSNGNMYREMSFQGPNYGNVIPRGGAAVDLQLLRSSATRIASGFYAVLGGGADNEASDSASTVGGGEGNTASGKYATIGGGHRNTGGNTYSTVAGGTNNSATGLGSGILSGQSNTAHGKFATISGGESNMSEGLGSSLGGGGFNTAGGDYSRVGGGHNNSAPGETAFVGGGWENVSYEEYTTIGGGYNNTASGQYSTVLGGRENEACGIYSSVGGGYRNIACGDYSTIAGGRENTASNIYSTVSGGRNNAARGEYSTVSGGESDTTIGQHSTVGGGNSNIAYSNYSTVSGGDNNDAGEIIFALGACALFGEYSTVGGGYNNKAYEIYSIVGGGSDNTARGEYSTVGGGVSNTASGEHSTVAGGSENTASGNYSTISGGSSNTTSRWFSTVGGGGQNTASGDYSTISGGYYAVADKYGQNAYASGQFANAGDAQTSVFVVRNLTDNATPTYLNLDGSTGSLQMRLNDQDVWAFRALVVGANDDGSERAGYTIEGVIYNQGGTVVINLSAASPVTLYETSGGLNATALVNGRALGIQVTGIAGETIRWVARIEVAQLNY